MTKYENICNNSLYFDFALQLFGPFSKGLHRRYDPRSGHSPSTSHFSLAKAGCSKLKEGPKSKSYFLQTLYNVPGSLS